jgi:hypothetical protein
VYEFLTRHLDEERLLPADCLQLLFDVSSHLLDINTAFTLMEDLCTQKILTTE